jgi:hypothetical protein
VRMAEQPPWPWCPPKMPTWMKSSLWSEVLLNEKWRNSSAVINTVPISSFLHFLRFN